MDLHKLRIFVTIAKFASFTRAAEHLHMTQPTVSQQLAMLETSVGAQLLERNTRRVYLTPAGEVLLDYAERLLALADEAIRVTRDAAGLADRTLRIGVGHTLATYLLPDVLRRYREQYPDHVVRISVGNTAQLLALLAANSIDLALVGSPAVHVDIAVEAFMHDKLAVIVAPDDDWVGRAEIQLSELRSRILLTREPGSALHATVERLLGPEFLAVEGVIQLGETEGIKRSVEAGLGVALIQLIAVQREVSAGTLIALPLRGGDDSRTYLVAYRKGRVMPTIEQDFVAVLKASTDHGAMTYQNQSRV
jgi:LysR family transcriptional regulator, low CO2-responsive transcriptional regulator